MYESFCVTCTYVVWFCIVLTEHCHVAALILPCPDVMWKCFRKKAQ